MKSSLNHMCSKARKKCFAPCYDMFVRAHMWLNYVHVANTFFFCYFIDEHNGSMNDRRKEHKHVSTFEITARLSYHMCPQTLSIYIYICILKLIIILWSLISYYFDHLLFNKRKVHWSYILFLSLKSFYIYINNWVSRST